MNTYLCMYRGKKITIEAVSSYEAQVRAAKMLNVRKAWDVVVIVIAVGPEDVPISTASL